MFTIVLLVVTFRLALDTQFWTWMHHLAYWGSLVVWCSFFRGIDTNQCSWKVRFHHDRVFHPWWLRHRRISLLGFLQCGKLCILLAPHASWCVLWHHPPQHELIAECSRRLSLCHGLPLPNMAQYLPARCSRAGT